MRYAGFGILLMAMACDTPFPPLEGKPVTHVFAGHESLVVSMNSSRVDRAAGQQLIALIDRLDDGQDPTRMAMVVGFPTLASEFSGLPNGTPVDFEAWYEAELCCDTTTTSERDMVTGVPREGPLPRDDSGSVALRQLDSFGSRQWRLTDLDYDGNKLAVGLTPTSCPTDDITELASESWFGVVMVFEETNGTWQVMQRLTRPIPYNCDGFGMRVEIDADWLMVGSPPLRGPNEPGTYTDAGWVYTYQLNGDRFTFRQALQNFPEGGSGSRPETRYGTTLTLSDGYAAVGVHSVSPSFTDPDKLFAYQTVAVYELDEGFWRFTQARLSKTATGSLRQRLYGTSPIHIAQGWLIDRQTTHPTASLVLSRLDETREVSLSVSEVAVSVLGLSFASDDTRLAVSGQSTDAEIFVSLYELSETQVSFEQTIFLTHEQTSFNRRVPLAILGDRLAVGPYRSTLALPFAVEPHMILSHEAEQFTLGGRATSLFRRVRGEWQEQWHFSGGQNQAWKPVFLGDELGVVTGERIELYHDQDLN